MLLKYDYGENDVFYYDADVKNYIDGLDVRSILEIAAKLYDSPYINEIYRKDLKDEYGVEDKSFFVEESNFDALTVAEDLISDVDEDALMTYFEDDILEYFREDANEQHYDSNVYRTDPYRYNGISPYDF